MDLKSELEKVEQYEAQNWFKPISGTYKVVLIGEPKEDRFFQEDGKVQDQAVFDIEVKAEKFKWTVSKGKTASSLWGQLLLVAKKNGFVFNGCLLTLIVQGSGKDKRYTVVEASEEA